MDRGRHPLVMSFGLFSTLFLKAKSMSLPVGNTWIINKARFRRFSVKKQTSHFNLAFNSSPQTFFSLERLSLRALILSDASSIENKVIYQYLKNIMLFLFHLPGNNSVAIVIVRRTVKFLLQNEKKPPNY